MPNPVDIKDRTPNPELIPYLEKLLEWAKAGKLRSLVTVSGWDDDNWNYGWRIDDRNTPRRMLAESHMCHYDLLTTVCLSDKTTAIGKALENR